MNLVEYEWERGLLVFWEGGGRATVFKLTGVQQAGWKMSEAAAKTTLPRCISLPDRPSLGAGGLVDPRAAAAFRATNKR